VPVENPRRSLARVIALALDGERVAIHEDPTNLASGPDLGKGNTVIRAASLGLVEPSSPVVPLVLHVPTRLSSRGVRPLPAPGALLRLGSGAVVVVDARANPGSQGIFSGCRYRGVEGGE